MQNNSNILIYQNDNGNIKIDVKFEDAEIGREAVVRNYRTVAGLI